ncbi:response regulator transcription factor [Parabacteroides faecis]|uniref:LytR/AlgR family response regulator transcription factor n=1 Tax=Parabacteroides TaxID=375288 RepID=UPI000EFFF4EF|nr:MULTISPECIES: LytTR family DNA-binding domain-containing protein [Parabacteroides]MBC8616456.1 response regulator transcription factor [Parabacteroides faecis]RHR95210.1 DNA-binding response regulator [Parabacteroides sp. AF14-59]
MNKIRAAIIEDEIPAARLLNKMLTELRPEWEILLLPGNVEGAVKWFNSNPHPDILFLDIQLTDGVSFSFIEQANPESMIVFTTAYDEYAIRAFKVNSIDYLLKPIDKERLTEALEKFEKLISKYYRPFGQQGDILEILQNITSPAKKYRTRFLISGEDKLFTLQVDDIAYFYSENKITFAVTHQNKEYIIDLSLDKLCEQLDPDRFFRTNRQTVVSVQAIQKIESYFLGKVVVKVIPPFKDKIIVSREKISAFKLWLNY